MKSNFVQIMARINLLQVVSIFKPAVLLLSMSG
uniref:Uncharacterized protein n=1 Tax=Schistosoma japonicum TaxID=6182 RepID=Q5BYP9_SCHJA|nr:unknown [Schistosoma japonicum]